MRRFALSVAAVVALSGVAGADPSIQVAGSLVSPNVEPPNPIVLQAWGGLNGTDFGTGARMPEDSGLVSHVTFTNSAGNAVIADKNVAGTTLNTWTTNSVTSNLNTPFYPTGFSNAAEVGADGFTSTAHNFTIAAPGPPFNFAAASTFYVCGGFYAVAAADNVEIANDGYFTGGVNVNGWRLVASGGVGFFETANGGVSTGLGCGTTSAGPNIICGGIAANGHLFEEVNGTFCDQGVPNYAANVTQGAFIGSLNSFQACTSTTDTVMEFMASTNPPTQALLQQIEKVYLAQTGTFGEQLTVTRATTATDTLPIGGATTCATPPCLFTWPAGVARVSAHGVFHENQVTNSNIQSEALDNAAYTKAATTVTANTTVGPDGNLTADTAAGTTGADVVDGTAISAAAATYTVSDWVKADGTHTTTIALRDGTSQTDLCTASSASTTWTRISCSAAATAAHSIDFRLYPGGVGVQGTTIAVGQDLEQSPFMTSYIATTSAAVTRNADSLQFTIAQTYNTPTLTLQDYEVSLVAQQETGAVQAAAIGVLGSDQSYVPLLRLTSGSATPVFFSDNGTGSAAAVGTITLNVQNRIIGKRVGTQVFCSAVTNGTAPNFGTGFTFGTQTAEPTVLNLGFDQVNTNIFSGWISNVCFARNGWACQ